VHLYIDSEGLSGGFCPAWNPLKSLFNSYQSSTGIVLDGRVQGWNQGVKVVNFYGPYTQRKEFWK
jgi:hypothetical protein